MNNIGIRFLPTSITSATFSGYSAIIYTNGIISNDDILYLLYVTYPLIYLLKIIQIGKCSKKNNTHIAIIIPSHLSINVPGIFIDFIMVIPGQSINLTCSVENIATDKITTKI